MFFISKSVADGIRALGERADVRRELDAIRAVPGFEIYANAIAEGVARHGHAAAKPQKHEAEARR